MKLSWQLTAIICSAFFSLAIVTSSCVMRPREPEYRYKTLATGGPGGYSCQFLYRIDRDGTPHRVLYAGQIPDKPPED